MHRHLVVVFLAVFALGFPTGCFFDFDKYAKEGVEGVPGPADAGSGTDAGGAGATDVGEVRSDSGDDATDVGEPRSDGGDEIADVASAPDASSDAGSDDASDTSYPSDAAADGGPETDAGEADTGPDAEVFDAGLDAGEPDVSTPTDAGSDVAAIDAGEDAGQPDVGSDDAGLLPTHLVGCPPAVTNKTDPVFSFDSPDPSAVFECSLDSGPWQGCTSPHGVPALQDGAHTFSVRAVVDSVPDPSPPACAWIQDTTQPETNILSKPESPSNLPNPAFTFGSTKPNSTFECRVDGAGWGACSSPKQYAGLQEGDRWFQVRATDLAGNTDPTPAEHAWIIDLTPPETTIDVKPPSLSNAVTADFSFTSNENGATFECRLDGAAWTVCVASKEYPGLSDGAHVFGVRATDPAGNTDQTPAESGWTVDTVAPDTVIDQKPANPTNTTVATFAFNSTEANATFECRVDAGAWTNCASPKQYQAILEGAHTFDVRATDLAGNVDQTPGTHEWTVNVTLPETSIDQKPANPTNVTTASFTFSSSEPGSTFECRLDGGAWAACSSPAEFLSVVEGSHTFEVKATDPAGNADQSAASYGWTVDTTSPNTSIDDKPSDPSSVDFATFVFSATEPGSTFECRLDGGVWATCTTPKQYTGFSDGTHTFDVRATDPAGNTDQTAAAFAWAVDSPPDTAIDQKPADPTNATSATFAFSASQPGSTFECRINGGPWGVCTSPVIYPTLSEGTHTFDVKATDSTGNTDPTPASFSWTIDITSPDTSILTKPTDPTSSTTADFTFSSTEPGSTFECKLDSGGWQACTTPKSYIGLSVASHTFNVRATDPAGNTDQPPATYTWTIAGAWAQVDLGGDHSCAVATDGTLWCWGQNSYGQVGDGTSTTRRTPTKIGIYTDWASISLGYRHACGIKATGSLWCWGDNQYGQLGDGTTITSNNPIQVGIDTAWTMVSVGYLFSCGKKNDGTLWCWGRNNAGQLGDGTTVEKHSPNQVGVESGWSSVSAAYAFACGLKTEGTLWCWGVNSKGQLGDGTTVGKTTPTQIGSDTDWMAVVAAGQHTCGIKTGRTLWCWGFNALGEVGDGTTTDRLSPLQIGSDTDWSSVSGGAYHTCGTKTTGTLWCWGDNTYGQLGDGTAWALAPVYIPKP